MKRAILIVGAPRSGTSVLAHVVNQLGVNFGDPKRFVDAEQNKHNPIFFELQELNAINDEIYASFGKNWSSFDWRPLMSDFSESVISRFDTRIREFIDSEFGRSEVIGLKDPRFCFTLPVWVTALERLGYKTDFVYSRRNLNSIFISNRIINKTFPSARNFRITVESILAASYFLKKYSMVRVDYEALISQPGKEVEKLCKEIGLDPALVDQACSVIAADLNHGHAVSQDELFNYFKIIYDINLDSASEYERYREIAFALTYEREEHIAGLNQGIAERDERIGEYHHAAVAREEHIASLNQGIAERDERIGEYHHAAVARDEHIASLNQGIAERDERIGEYHHAAVAREEHIASLSQRFAECEKTITNILTSTSWRVTAPMRAIFKHIFGKS